MKFNIHFTTAAVSDLDSIFEYISVTLDAPGAAHKLMKKIETTISALSDFPFVGRFVDNKKLKQYGYRKLIIDHYIVIYSIDEIQKQINIMRLFYAASDYLNFL